jgi:hypothetical protein
MDITSDPLFRQSGHGDFLRQIPYAAKVDEPPVPARSRQTDSRQGADDPVAGTGTFQTMWRTIGSHIGDYHNYPRVVGETGGKDYIFVHPSADPQAVAVAVVRGPSSTRGRSVRQLQGFTFPKASGRICATASSA